MRLAIALIFVLILTALRADPPPSQLVGLWHIVSASNRSGQDITPHGGGLELDFRQDGTLLETVVSPAHAGDEPLRYRCHYTFQRPDMISYTYRRAGQTNTQRQRVHVDGNLATFQNLDSGTISKMRRVRKSEFGPPRDISELPK